MKKQKTEYDSLKKENEELKEKLRLPSINSTTDSSKLEEEDLSQFFKDDSFDSDFLDNTDRTSTQLNTKAE